MSALRKRLENRYAALLKERLPHVPHWKELTDNILPRRGRYYFEDRNKGGDRNSKIINNTGTIASQSLVAILSSGLTNPAHPWFRLGTPDPALMEIGDVREWLSDVERIIRGVFHRSNVYNVLPIIYSEASTFATGAAIVVEDHEDVIRLYPMTVGEYCIALNERLEVDTMYREIPMTVGTLVRRFGEDKVSTGVLSSYKLGNVDDWVKVIHAIEPNIDRNTKSKFAKDKPFRSVYYEYASKGRKLLLESGFDEFPVLAPRWQVSGGDIYGTSCPGMSALGDIKQLQMLELKKAQGVEKMVSPPMVAPSSMQNSRLSNLPGHVNFVPAGEFGQKFEKLFDTNLPINYLIDDGNRCELRIKRAFREDLVLGISSMNRKNITAREVDEIHEEKQQVLGPVLEIFNDELLSPLVDRTFAILESRGMLPEAPAELAEVDLKVEFISILAQAQQAVGTSAIQRLVSYVGQIAALDPMVMDKIDLDQSVDEMGMMLGVSQKIVRSDEKVKSRRDGRAEAEERAVEAQRTAEAANTAKTMSETDISGESALSGLIASEEGGV